MLHYLLMKYCTVVYLLFQNTRLFLYYCLLWQGCQHQTGGNETQTYLYSYFNMCMPILGTSIK